MRATGRTGHRTLAQRRPALRAKEFVEFTRGQHEQQTLAHGLERLRISFLQDFRNSHPSPNHQRAWRSSGEIQWKLGHLSRIQATLASRHIDPGSLPHTAAYFDLVAFLAIIAITVILVIGIKESANLNSAIVMIKVSIVLVFIGVVGYYAIGHRALFWANWHPFIPPNLGTFGAFGWSEMLAGRA